MKAHSKPVPDGLFVAVLLTLLFLFASIISFAQGQVVIKGTVLSSEDTKQRPNAEVIASDGTRMPLAIRPNGKFWVCAPANDKYTLRFTQPGAVSKEITVDARMACPGGACKDRKLEFDVVLHAAIGDEAMRFTGPVGRIEFRSSTGKPHVAHHYELVPVSTLIALEDERDPR